MRSYSLPSLLYSLGVAADIFNSASAFVPIGSSFPTKATTLQATSDESAEVTFPNPDLNAVEVATLCMNAMKTKKCNDSLEICFNFSSDRCRAAVGGSLEEFIQYADNPVFGALVNCDDYKILSIGPIIPGGQHRGEMQTVLMDIKKGFTVNDAIKAAEQKQRKRPTIEERLRQRELKERGETEEVVEEDRSRRFLWTLQKERRPPRQDCWLVHEVLFTKNAFQLLL
jgi:hypothetical protein